MVTSLWRQWDPVWSNQQHEERICRTSGATQWPHHGDETSNSRDDFSSRLNGPKFRKGRPERPTHDVHRKIPVCSSVLCVGWRQHKNLTSRCPEAVPCSWTSQTSELVVQIRSSNITCLHVFCYNNRKKARISFKKPKLQDNDLPCRCQAMLKRKYTLAAI